MNLYLENLFPKNHWRLIATLECMLLATGWVTLAVTVHPAISSDGEIRFQALIDIYCQGVIPHSKYSLIQPILSLPVAWISDTLAIDMRVGVAYFNLLIFLVGSIAIYWPIKSLFGYSVSRSFLLILAAASMFPHHLQYYFGEVLTSFCLSYGFVQYKRSHISAIVALSIGVINTPALIPALGMATLVQIAKERRDRRMLLVFIIACTGVLLEVWLKHGSLQASPYASTGEAGYKTILPYSGLPGFSYPLFFGVLSITLSFGKGLIFYIPGICLGFDMQLRSVLARVDLPWEAGAAFIAASICTYAMWWSWYGGAFWGPRFFLYLCIPASLFIALLLSEQHEKNKIQKVIIFFVLCLSMWVAANGYIYGQANMGDCWANQYAQEFLCWYVPEFSALWRPFVMGFNISADKYYQVFFAGWQGLVLVVLIAKMVSFRRANK